MSPHHREALRVLPRLPQRFTLSDVRFVAAAQHPPVLVAQALEEAGHVERLHLNGAAWSKVGSAVHQTAVQLLVCGGRSGAEQAVVNAGLDAWGASYGPIQALVHGACPDPEAGGLSVDASAERWAWARRVLSTPTPADWRLHGRRAGPLRNASMGDMLLLRRLRGWPVAVAAFPGGRGTANMEAVATARRLPLFRADPEHARWRLAQVPASPPRRIDAVVPVAMASALRLLRGASDSFAVGRQLLGRAAAGAVVALHCPMQRDEQAGDTVERRLRAALEGRIFAVARLSAGGQLDEVWPVCGIEAPSRAQPWRPNGALIEQACTALSATTRWGAQPPSHRAHAVLVDAMRRTPLGVTAEGACQALASAGVVAIGDDGQEVAIGEGATMVMLLELAGRGDCVRRGPRFQLRGLLDEPTPCPLDSDER